MGLPGPGAAHCPASADGIGAVVGGFLGWGKKVSRSWTSGHGRSSGLSCAAGGRVWRLSRALLRETECATDSCFAGLCASIVGFSANCGHVLVTRLAL